MRLRVSSHTVNTQTDEGVIVYNNNNIPGMAFEGTQFSLGLISIDEQY